MSDWFFPDIEDTKCTESQRKDPLEEDLPAENDVGSTEYKRKISSLAPRRFRKLVTQLRFRLREGYGKATYYIGVDDDGKISDVDPSTLRTSMRTFRNMAKVAQAEVGEVKKLSSDGKTFYQIEVISDLSC